jgi:O-antigen chain-terminating methyltransferase
MVLKLLRQRLRRLVGLPQVEQEVSNLLASNHRVVVGSNKVSDELQLLRDNVAQLRAEWSAVQKAAGASPVAAAAGEADAGFLDDFYYRFEERFRGTRAEVTARLKDYLPYLAGLKQRLPSLPVLDIGCGRGEWLELVQAQGLKAKGIDLNARMVRECQEAGLDAAHEEGVAYLRRQPSNAFGAVCAFHVVEHVSFADLMRLFHEAHRVVAPGGFVLFETPNPENLLVGSCTFYTDPTHKNPLPPQALGFMLEQAGFRRSDCLRLRATPRAGASTDPDLAAIAERFHAATDYAIIGFKDDDR